MNRDIQALKSGSFDVLVIGGGIYGTWIARHAAHAGLKTALVERDDWGSGTSSVSSKLLHGGLRYLERFQLGLVRKSLHERRELHRLLPHHVRPLRFLLPVYRDSRVGRLRLKAGLWLYDRLAGTNQPVGPHQSLSASQLIEKEPALRPDTLLGGFSYGDCCTDDARMIVEIVDSAIGAGAVAANHVSADELLVENGRAVGARLRDCETSTTFDVRATVVVNAAGPWVFRIPGLPPMGDLPPVRLTKGVHLVMPALSSDHAVLLTAREDGRVFFLIPWYGRTLLGTTDTDFQGSPDDLRLEHADVDYLLAAARDYLNQPWSQSDILGTFVGLRTLQNQTGKNASAVSREWSVDEPIPGLLTSVGGKYTSARVDAWEVRNQILHRLGRSVDAVPDAMPMAWYTGPDYTAWAATMTDEARSAGIDRDTAAACVRRYGAKLPELIASVAERPELAKRIVPELVFCRAEAVHAATHEMARTLIDVLRRRIPLIILSKPPTDVVTDVCHLVGHILNWDSARRQHETETVLEHCRSQFPWRDDSV